MNLNRVVAIVASVLALVAGLLPAIANLDTTSTAGLLVGLAGVIAVVVKWLDGWSKWERAVPAEGSPASAGAPAGYPPEDEDSQADLAAETPAPGSLGD